MMKLKTFILLILFLTSSHLWSANEQPEIADSSASLERWYRIELLIYRQKPTLDAIEEVWPHDITLSYPATWVRLKSQEEYIASPHPHPVLASWLSRIKTGPYTPFVLQPDSAKSLTKAAKQIERLEEGVLFHGVWWQPFIQNDTHESPAILIKAGKSYGNHAELEGSINFKLSRYLHISTNLWLSEYAENPDFGNMEGIWPALPLAPDLSALTSSDIYQEADSMISADAVMTENLLHPSQVILIRQSRRMRSEEIHYIDHPKIGIVVRLTPDTKQE